MLLSETIIDIYTKNPDMSGVRLIGELLTIHLPPDTEIQAVHGKRVLNSYNCAIRQLKKDFPDCIMKELEFKDLFEIQ